MTHLQWQINRDNKTFDSTINYKHQFRFGREFHILGQTILRASFFIQMPLFVTFFAHNKNCTPLCLTFAFHKTTILMCSLFGDSVQTNIIDWFNITVTVNIGVLLFIIFTWFSMLHQFFILFSIKYLICIRDEYSDLKCSKVTEILNWKCIKMCEKHYQYAIGCEYHITDAKWKRMWKLALAVDQRKWYIEMNQIEWNQFSEVPLLSILRSAMQMNTT